MTREEIIKAAQAYYPSGILHEEAKVSAFVRGAKWADQTMLDRACKWLLNVDYDSLRYRDYCEGFNEEMFVDDFRKAMEGGVE